MVIDSKLIFMKTSFNVILVLGLLSLGFLSCNEVRTQEQTQEYYILNDYVERGCLKDGTIIVNEDGVTVYRRASYKSGKLIDFFADMTYKFLDGSKSGKWYSSKCNTIQERPEAYQSHLSEGEGIPETQPETQSQRQWVNCSECHGTGLEQCYECHGSGQLECSTTRIYRYQCDGCENMAPCPRCNGTAIVKCHECYGRGNKGNCDNCNGRGQVLL
jgi:hypothetical protein